jgi:hypothetical protein
MCGFQMKQTESECTTGLFKMESESTLRCLLLIGHFQEMQTWAATASIQPLH